MNPPAAAIFGAITVDLPKHNRAFGILPNLIFSDIMIIVGVGVALLLILAGGIYAWVKLRRRRRRVSSGEKVYHRRGSDDSGEETDSEPEEPEHRHSPGGRRRYKYRVRRRTHRVRNPTLSETGGLPPAKSQEPTQP